MFNPIVEFNTIAYNLLKSSYPEWFNPLINLNPQNNTLEFTWNGSIIGIGAYYDGGSLWADVYESDHLGNKSVVETFQVNTQYDATNIVSYALNMSMDN